uniref:Transposase (Putative), gypsy type n=1 Tax=Tanacetum cinerariifolium TaxID=118510 RepID=A0A699GJ28_TANCI|nr:hypothetical protein [Tanacetum cinerariifolium]
MLTQFPNQTSIYIPTAAYATHRHGTLPHQEYLLEFTSEYDISEALHLELSGPEERIVDFPEGKVGWMSFSKRSGKNTPQCYTKPLDSLKNWNNRFFWVDERVFPTVVDWRTSAPKDGMPAENTYFPKAVMILNTHRTPIQKQPEALLCLVGLSRRYYLGDEVYLIFFHDDDRDMDLFSLIRAPNPTKLKTDTSPRVAYEVPLLTVTASRVIKMEDPAATTDSSEVPSTIERSPLDFANENPSHQSTGLEDQGQEAVALEVPPLENVTTMGVAPEAGQVEGIAATGPHVVKERRKRGNDKVDTNAPPKLLRRDHVDPRPTESTPVDVSDLDPLSFTDPQSRPSADVTQSSKGAAEAGDPKSKNTSFTSMVGSPESIYRPERARQDKRIQARENKIKNLETLLEAETDMKKAAEGRSAKLSKELENMRALFSDLQEFKQYKDNRVEQRYVEMDACLDALSIDFDEELYPHMLTEIACHRWVIRHRLRLAVMKCGESTELRQAFADVVLAGIAKEAEAKYIEALHALKDLKYPIVDQLGNLKDAPMDVIMASLHLESDTGDDAPQSDGVPISMPTVAPQGLAILLADAATQTEISEDGASPRLLRLSS